MQREVTYITTTETTTHATNFHVAGCGKMLQKIHEITSTFRNILFQLAIKVARQVAHVQ